ncbi:MAG: hypothetical protein ACUVUQ_03580 [Thermodesulfovibrionales bacterium]
MFRSKKDKPNNFCKLTKRPLGKILIDGNFITEGDLNKALEIQVQNNSLLGEILVQLGVLDPFDLKIALSLQKDMASLNNSLRLAAGVRNLLGELLIQSKRIKPEQLEYALQEAYKTGEKIGEVFKRLGLLSEQELNGLLTFQKNQSEPQTIKLRLGQLLVDTGHITPEQLQNALNQQRLIPHKKIGELLVEAGYVTQEQINHGLKLQQKFLTAVLAAILSLSSTLTPSIEQSGADSNQKQIVVDKMSNIHLTLNVIHQIPEVVISHADIMRGYVEIKSASQIEVRSNVFFFLRFSGLEDPFEEVFVQGFGKEILINKSGNAFFLPEVRGYATFELSYKFLLSKNAQPGTYVWPIKITAHPIMMA